MNTVTLICFDKSHIMCPADKKLLGHQLCINPQMKIACSKYTISSCLSEYLLKTRAQLFQGTTQHLI